MGCCWDAWSIIIAAHNILEYSYVHFDSGSGQESHWGRRAVQKAAKERGEWFRDTVLFPGLGCSGNGENPLWIKTSLAQVLSPLPTNKTTKPSQTIAIFYTDKTKPQRSLDLRISLNALPLWGRILAVLQQPRCCFSRDTVAFAGYLRGSRAPSKAGAWHIVLFMFWSLGRSLLVLSCAFGFSTDRSTCQAELDNVCLLAQLKYSCLCSAPSSEPSASQGMEFACREWTTAQERASRVVWGIKDIEGPLGLAASGGSKLRRERGWRSPNNCERRNMRTCGELRQRKGCPRERKRNHREGGERGKVGKWQGGSRGGTSAGVRTAAACPCQGAVPSAWQRAYGSGSLCTYRKSQRHHRCQCPCEEKDGVLWAVWSPMSPPPPNTKIRARSCCHVCPVSPNMSTDSGDRHADLFTSSHPCALPAEMGSSSMGWAWLWPLLCCAQMVALSQAARSRRPSCMEGQRQPIAPCHQQHLSSAWAGPTWGTTD